MKNLTRLTVLSSLSALALVSAFATGCTESSTTPLKGAPDGGDSPEGCSTEGTGSLQVEVTGLPAGVAGKVKVAGTGAPVDVTATTTLPDQAAGTVAVSAERVIVADSIVRSIYVPTVSKSSVCIGADESVTVSYALLGSSNKLWSTNGNSDSGHVLGFAGSVLGATGTPTASVAVKGAVAGAPGKVVAFDKDGNMWSFGATVGDAPLLRFPAASLGASGEKTPDRSINPALSGCGPAFTGMAFDPSGALWATVLCEDKVLRLGADKLSASGEITPATEDFATGVKAPRHIAFDKTGNMWVSDEASVHMFSAASLPAGQPHTSTFKISAKAENDAELPPDALAFDKDGSLWVSNFGGNVIYKLTPADLTPAGAEKTVVPSIAITVSVGALIESLAFDESGGLWTTFSQGKLARLAPEQLGTSSGAGDPTNPATIITSADIGYAVGIAFFPAPAALPIYSALP